MTRLAGRCFASLASAALLVLAGCGGGDPSDTPAGGEHVGDLTTTTDEPRTGDIDVPEVPGTYPVAVPSLGFGVAVPEDWQATRLSEPALERLREAQLAEPFFLDAAENVAATGAVFYAAGVDEAGRVAELKVSVQADADTDADALRALADEVAASAELEDTAVVDDLADGRIRIDYRVTLPSAEDGEPIEAQGSQILVPDGDRIWALIVTSEDDATHRGLLDVFETSFVVG